MTTVRREHDSRGSEDYAEEFIRAVMHLGEARAPQPSEPKIASEQAQLLRDRELLGRSTERLAQPDRVQVKERNGIWVVKVDGSFHGEYHRKEHALAAAALLKLSSQ
jgi:hypothetical protein